MNKLSNPAFRLIFLLCLALLASACATSVSKDAKVSRAELAKYDTMTPEEALDSYENMVKGASDANMAFLAPKHFKNAKEILEKAKKDVEKKRRKSLIVSRISKGENIVDEGQRVMIDVSKRLSEELKIKASLDKRKIPESMQKKYKGAMSDLSKLIVKIELDKGNINKDQTKLLARLQALEIDAVKHYALSEAKSIIEEVGNNKGKKLIPKTYNETLTIYQNAENNISASPNDEQQVKNESAKATFAAKHAEAVLEQVTNLQKQYKESPEDVVLAEEGRLKRIGDALKHEDVRDQNLEQQARTLALAAKAIVGSKDQQTKITEQLSQAQTSANEQQATITSLTEDNAKLKAETSKKDEQLVRLSAQIVRLESELKDTKARAEQVVVMSAKIIQQDEKIKQQAQLIEKLQAE